MLLRRNAARQSHSSAQYRCGESLTESFFFPARIVLLAGLSVVVGNFVSNASSDRTATRPRRENAHADSALVETLRPGKLGGASRALPIDEAACALRPTYRNCRDGARSRLTRYFSSINFLFARSGSTWLQVSRNSLDHTLRFILASRSYQRTTYTSRA